MDDDILSTQNLAFEPYFFRDLETFQTLRNEILPALIAQAEQNQKTLRLWCAGCATGEDAYSLAMLLAGLLGDALPLWNIRIFATDADEAALNFTKQGIYDESHMRNISKEERALWFKRVNQRYGVSKILRKMVIIGHHNLTDNVPFARMHLIMCREPLFSCTHERQQELIRLFAFSLAPRHGYLILSRSELVTVSPLCFRHITETLPIYQSASYVSNRKTAINDNSASLLKQLLHYQGLVPEGGVTPPPPLSLQEVLFRLAPNGIIVIDRSYRIITANRAAHRLCALPEQTDLQDFLHSVPGLPYTSVRSAIDAVFHEGNTQVVPEAELMLTQGGNGRVLNMYICLLPAEVAAPDYVVIYLQEITEQTIVRQAHHNTLEAFHNLQLSHAALTQKHAQMAHNYANLQKTSAEILSLYDQLQVAFEESQAAKEVLEQDQAALQEELETVSAALLLCQTAPESAH